LQVVIGEQMGKSVAVRKMVGVNSLTIQAIKMILEAPGLTVPKVCILCGGPDWPTSVLTGILGLSRVEMLAGTIPGVILIMPCVVAGGLMLMKQDPAMAPLASLALSGAAMTQGLSLFTACYYVEGTVDREGEWLRQMPIDEEVQALEKRETLQREKYAFATKWVRMPRPMQALLVASALAMSAACYIFNLLASHTFLPYSITDTVSEKLGGNVLNVVQPLGWVALGLFAGAIVLARWFVWLGHRAADLQEEMVHDKVWWHYRRAGGVTF
jgi:hypothetical protein